ncbi:exopolygalacturonase-like [Cornus florida]|uniref:exopolygalacturonase-like n=1 Tax=Cornus florida TaxID=4283 RepID=UPI00289EEA5C|nr:exopolygalacturonase-like [Cornus florida]
MVVEGGNGNSGKRQWWWLWQTVAVAVVKGGGSVCITNAQLQPKVFDVFQYGAVADGKTDNSKAFSKAWNESCKWQGRSSVLIPLGSYFLNSLVLSGPCNGPVELLIKGVLKAPSEPAQFLNTHNWIIIQAVQNLRITGGGTLDGQGASGWSFNTCSTGHCPGLPASMLLYFINNSEISHINSLNSKNVHLNIFGCRDMNLSQIGISAPGDSPNTDGIHISASTNIRLSVMNIATGDDCVSLGPENRRIHISKSFCGPGHGISVGSLGRTDEEQHVTRLVVTNCTFTRTLNGLRIKTWAGAPNDGGGVVSNMLFDSIVVNDVSSPINIDQQYCPFPPCRQDSSLIQIANITFSNIQGTSATREAVKLVCSESKPGKNIVLENINLKYLGHEGPAISTCAHANVISRGQVIPPACS